LGLGSLDLAFWTPLWLEQAGKGAAETWTPHKCDLERAPAESPLETLDVKVLSRRSQLRRAQFSAAPFPACSHYSDAWNLVTLPSLF